ncbi:hypothetical protein GCM10007940_12170 [Portibacter lacus]|uniref:TIGR00374 family protein n=2 Tax=Portibacter lacus TaxID=1099794 RepID=A0AA37WE03_9BACT|nr:hypothetical protein GCM10007940_12170 [Portibacter lacus]
MLIGIGVVVFLLWKQFDRSAFNDIEWGIWTLGWLMLGVFFYVIRHLAYAARLVILSDNVFSWRKAIQLIFIWEFSTAVSPTSLGGSAVAMFFLSQEKIKTAKAVTIVLYSVVLDTLFFVISLPLLYIILGPLVIRPEMETLFDINGYGITFLFVFFAMMTYGFVFYYGLFHRPDQIKKLLNFIGNRKILRRFKKKIINTGIDIEKSSKTLRAKSPLFHLKAILSTFTAWFFKFTLIFCVIYAFIHDLPRTFYNTAMIYGRYETMFTITAASPTPGGSGLAEYLFGGFYSDYVPITLAVVIAFAWRLIAYYTYLFAGVIIVPQWIRKIYKKNKLSL